MGKLKSSTNNKEFKIMNIILNSLFVKELKKDYLGAIISFNKKII